MGLTDQIKKTALKTAFSYLEKNPEENAPKLMAWVDKLAGNGPDSFQSQRDAIRAVINDPNNNMHQLVMDILTETDSEVLKATFVNFFLNANIIGWPVQEKNREKYGCNIPWAILLDPTSACNLHCTGCWAAEYGNKLNLTFDEIDSIITQGKELGVYMYIYTGGEPLVRKNDLIALCNKHNDCQFLSFTNGTLIDEEFANEMLRVKNFIPAISLEGFEEATDGRRGNGVYQKATRAMKILHDKHLPFGISACYTSANIDSIASDEYIDFICKLGARFIWYFHYMPVGNDAAPQLLPNPEQREYMYHRIRELRATKPIFAMDFQNDGEYVGGCIAGGRRYLHINANGDVDPCVFIHYSNSNIREHIEITPSDIFAHVDAGGALCSTAAVNIDEFMNCFAKYSDQYDSVICITISSEMSSCYQNACLAASSFSNVYVVDSRNLSSAQGLIALDAAKLSKSGLSGREIARILEEETANVQSSFLLDRLDYMQKGGRCSTIAALGANLMHLKPCISVHEGKMGVRKKYRGSFEHCMVQYTKELLERCPNSRNDTVIVVHPAADRAAVEATIRTLREDGRFEAIYESRTGCTAF